MPLSPLTGAFRSDNWGVSGDLIFTIFPISLTSAVSQGVQTGQGLCSGHDARPNCNHSRMGGANIHPARQGRCCSSRQGRSQARCQGCYWCLKAEAGRRLRAMPGCRHHHRPACALSHLSDANSPFTPTEKQQYKGYSHRIALSAAGAIIHDNFRCAEPVRSKRAYNTPCIWPLMLAGFNMPHAENSSENSSSTLLTSQ
jgi:hypothetical protein